MSSSILTRGATKDVRTLVKDVRDQGFRVQHGGASLLIFAREADDPCGEIPLKVHDHRALKNLRAELRRAGILPRPQKPRRVGTGRARRSSPVPAASPEKQQTRDDYDWLRRPYDKERSRILRERLRVFLEESGGASARNRRMFAAAALAYARKHDLRSFSSEQPQLAAQNALRFLLHRDGALSIWTLKLFHETLDEAEARLQRIKRQQAAA